jgi:hypothetical protein
MPGRERWLEVTFNMPVATELTKPSAYTLSGGQRLFPRVISVTRLLDTLLALELDMIGDFSVYTLTVNALDIDPFFASHKLRFRLACDDSFDCAPPRQEAQAPQNVPVAIDYLAKDYASFRQALLEFIPTRMPAWTERSEADLGMMLLELFAAAADTLSYTQDRVANEAFLDSAKQRQSVAGHLALIGHDMDPGASAWTWLQFTVDKKGPSKTLAAGQGVCNVPVHAGDANIVFETVADITVRYKHNDMAVYTWGNRECCLPRHARSLALVGNDLELQAGDHVLLDGGLGRRDIVRLTKVEPTVHHPPGAADSVALTMISWSKATPLHHDYCVGVGGTVGSSPLAGLTVRGNLVPATHGKTVREVLITGLSDELRQGLGLRLSHAPLAYLHPDTPGQPPSAPPGSFPPQPARRLSTLKLKVDEDDKWVEKPTLLESRPNDKHYRVELDDLGNAIIRFGRKGLGLSGPPEDFAKISATYRVGGGTSGNVPPEVLTRLMPVEGQKLSDISVKNPLAAVGGRHPESGDHARRFAPATFRKPLVALTAADFQAAAEEFRDAAGGKPVQRAKAAFRWTGSWLTATLAIDPLGLQQGEGQLRQELLAFLETRRLAASDLEVTGALYVPVELILAIRLKPGFLPGDVEPAVLNKLSGTEQANGRKGFFHPDHFTFGQSLHVSRLFAAVYVVPGLESARIERLCRFGTPEPERQTEINLAQGFLGVGPDEIIRLDNDRNSPHHGTLRVRAGEGRP